MRFSLLLISAALCGVTPAFAINKCKTADGKFVFQDKPCLSGQGGEIEVKPASGNAAPVQQTAPVVGGAEVTAKPETETERLDKLAAQIRNSSRLRSLETSIIPGARATMLAQKNRCDKDMEALKRQQPAANNNLAGATWLQSISTEMSALAVRCDTEAKSMASNLDVLLKEQSDLKAAQNRQ